MAQYDDEPTHAIHPTLERKLIEARAWRDQHAALNGGEYKYDLVDESLDSVNRGIALLFELVEIVEDTWGFAEEPTA